MQSEVSSASRSAEVGETVEKPKGGRLLLGAGGLVPSRPGCPFGRIEPPIRNTEYKVTVTPLLPGTLRCNKRPRRARRGRQRTGGWKEGQVPCWGWRRNSTANPTTRGASQCSLDRWDGGLVALSTFYEYCKGHTSGCRCGIC